jgi:hypothetical protein
MESPWCLIIHIGQNCPETREYYILRAKGPDYPWFGFNDVHVGNLYEAEERTSWRGPYGQK